MPVIQALVVLIVVIVIVWWALRRSTKDSARQAPAVHAHETHVEPEKPIEAVRAEIVEIAAAEEPASAVEAIPAVEPVEAVAAVRAPEPVAVLEPEVEVKPDDLILIEGIGPRISGVLKSHGVNTFAQLAGMQPGEIKAILTGVDERLGRIADPTTWPEQARLAAKGDLEGLQKLQDSLKGGRAK